MYSYNFLTKELSTIFDNISTIVNNCQYLELKCSAEQAVVVEIFGRLMVGLPVEVLGTISGITMNSETTGYFLKGYTKVWFSIHEHILYLRCRN